MHVGEAPPRVRLAELVAALSLGVDLGFGQPMEHVLRQCLIALRIAERFGLDAEQRSTVYYTALLIDVGCHTDAHEQAKWFGDDIAMKSGKYDHEFRSMRAALSGMRMLGAGRPPIERFRISLEFARSGHREVGKMIEGHAAIARSLAAELELSPDVQEALGAAYEQWDGKGWPGRVSGECVPVASRISQLAEFVEVAHRMGGEDEARELARRRAGRQFDPALAGIVVEYAGQLLVDLDELRTWDEVIAAEPALAISLPTERFDSALVAVHPASA